MGKLKPLVLDPEVHHYERQPGETDKAWEAFHEYRDMVTWNNNKRSIRKLSDKMEKSRVNLERWSTANQWQMRCREWDRHLDNLARSEYEREIAQMQKRHAQAVPGFSANHYTHPKSFASEDGVRPSKRSAPRFRSWTQSSFCIWRCVVHTRSLMWLRWNV